MPQALIQKNRVSNSRMPCYAIKVATPGKYYNTLSQLQNLERVNVKWFNLQLKLELDLFWACL